MYSSSFYKNRITSHTVDNPTDDNLYVDIKVINNGDTRTVDATYKQTKTIQVLDNPSNYYLTMVRWKVPGFEFPLLIFPVQNNQADPNLSEYSITFETATDTFQYFLFYTNYNTVDFPPTNAIPTQEASSYYFVYEYQHMLDMVNHALNMCFENVTGKPVGSVVPYMIYNPETKLFSLIVQESQYSVDLEPTPAPPANPTTQPTFDADIKIYFNFSLYSLFNGLPSRRIPENSAEASDGRDVQILPADYGNNDLPDGYLEIKQNYSSIAFWSPVKQIVFITELIPIKAAFTTTSGNSFRKILTDFEPIADTNTDVRTTLQYFPQGVYRLTDLTGTQPLYNIDLKAIWLDLDGNEYPVQIAPFQQFSAKLLFVKRNLYKSDNLIYER